MGSTVNKNREQKMRPIDRKVCKAVRQGFTQKISVPLNVLYDSVVILTFPAGSLLSRALFLFYHGGAEIIKEHRDDYAKNNK